MTEQTQCPKCGSEALIFVQVGNCHACGRVWIESDVAWLRSQLADVKAERDALVAKRADLPPDPRPSAMPIMEVTFS